MAKFGMIFKSIFFTSSILLVLFFISCGVSYYRYHENLFISLNESTNIYFNFFRVVYDEDSNMYSQYNVLNGPGVTKDANFMFEISITCEDENIEQMNIMKFDSLAIKIIEKDLIIRPTLYIDTIIYPFPDGIQRTMRYGPFNIEGFIPKKAEFEIYYSLDKDVGVENIPPNPIVGESILNKKSILKDFLDGR